eukprot:5944248-Pyramimonas_sp.AAC.1
MTRPSATASFLSVSSCNTCLRFWSGAAKMSTSWPAGVVARGLRRSPRPRRTHPSTVAARLAPSSGGPSKR